MHCKNFLFQTYLLRNRYVKFMYLHPCSCFENHLRRLTIVKKNKGTFLEHPSLYQCKTIKGRNLCFAYVIRKSITRSENLSTNRISTRQSSHNKVYLFFNLLGSNLGWLVSLFLSFNFSFSTPFFM